MTEEKKRIRVNFPAHLQGGVYSNNLVVGHTREEFILDFMMIAPPTGAINARVVVNPGHLKRIIAILKDNLQKYEAKYGEIKSAEEPKVRIGFQP